MAYEYVDGNVLAGPLLEVFALGMTAATEQCASCGRAGPVATLRVYSRAPGLVALPWLRPGRSALPPRAGRRLARCSRRGHAVGDRPQMRAISLELLDQPLVGVHRSHSPVGVRHSPDEPHHRDVTEER